MNCAVDKYNNTQKSSSTEAGPYAGEATAIAVTDIHGKLGRHVTRHPNV